MAHTFLVGRTLARAQAIQILFQAEQTNRSVKEVLQGDYLIEHGPLDPYAQELLDAIDAYLPQIDELLQETSHSWDVNRMPACDRALLRLAVFELMYEKDMPEAIIIDEAVKLAKGFGSDKSSQFVNGVLGKIAEQVRTNDE